MKLEMASNTKLFSVSCVYKKKIGTKSIFPASATKIQKYLFVVNLSKKKYLPTDHFIFQWSGYGKQTIS